MAKRRIIGGRAESGFSLLEMILATSVLLLGLVGVAQLVPASLLLNQTNRSSSSSLVMAQRELDQMLVRPLADAGFIDAANNACVLGDPTLPGQVVGSPIIMAANRALIDFSQATVPGYNFTYVDPNDPNQATWDVRWAVITMVGINPTVVMSKRFIVGAHQVGGVGFVLPITLDATVSK